MAIAFPNPLLAPVMTATFPSRLLFDMRTNFYSLVNDDKIAGRFCESGRKAPRGNSGSRSLLSFRLARGIVKLPGQAATLGPAHVLSPGEQRFSTSIHKD